MTTTVTDLLGRLKSMGYDLHLEGERVRFKYAGEGEPPEGVKTLLDTLRNHKPEVVVASLMGAMPKPYLEADGGLAIPFGSGSRYHWWNGGQTTAESIEELKGAINA